MNYGFSVVEGRLIQVRSVRNELHRARALRENTAWRSRYEDGTSPDSQYELTGLGSLWNG